jgi:hypothetical protein
VHSYPDRHTASAHPELRVTQGSSSNPAGCRPQPRVPPCPYHQIGELIPLRHRRRFVPRQEFAAMSRSAPGIDIETFRADQQAAFDHDTDSPYER